MHCRSIPFSFSTHGYRYPPSLPHTFRSPFADRPRIRILLRPFVAGPPSVRGRREKGGKNPRPGFDYGLRRGAEMGGEKGGNAYRTLTLRTYLRCGCV